MTKSLWLSSLIMVAECGSFTRAAERLGITQAAVSQHIQRLEAEFGSVLIRRPRKMELTPTGQKLLAYAREMQMARRRLLSSLEEDTPYRGDLTLATPGSIGLHIYPLLLQMQVEHPGLSIQHRFAPTADILSAVLERRAEFGLVTSKPDDLRLATRRFASEALSLVVPAEQAGTGWDDLMRLGFIDHPDGRDMAMRLLSRRYPGCSVAALPVKGFSNQIGLILEPVALGLGFTVLPHFAVQAFARQAAIRVVTGTPQVMDTLWLIHRAEWPLSARARYVLGRLAEQTRTAPDP